MPTKTSLDSSNIHDLLHEHLDIMLAECNHILKSAAPSKRQKERPSFMERELSLLKVGLKESHVKLVDSLLDYFRGNAGRLNYCDRLSAGRVIGSGLVEGACKNLVGRRLKQTGASWRLSQANRMASICSVLYSDQWKLGW